MRLIQRCGRIAIIVDYKGRTWLTIRKKFRHTSRRRRIKKGDRSVRYFPIKELKINEVMTPNDPHRCENGTFPSIPFHP